MDGGDIIGTWMIHPASEASPRSRMIKAMTEPAATTTKTWDMMLAGLGMGLISARGGDDGYVRETSDEYDELVALWSA